MSDCSTEAMKPKKPPRTCGNCDHGLRTLVTCWEGDPQGGHHAPNEPSCPKWSERKQEGMCSCSRSRGYDDLLERFQQLEQVAKLMLRGYRNLKDVNCLAREVYEELCGQFEALGVDVDG